MKGIIQHKFYNMDEIAIMLGVARKSVRNILSKANIKKYKTNGSRVGLYSEEQINVLNKKRELNTTDIIDYYNTYFINTPQIFESKMNKDEE